MPGALRVGSIPQGGNRQAISIGNRPSRASIVLIGLAMVAAMLFVTVAALPYFTFLAYDAPANTWMKCDLAFTTPSARGSCCTSWAASHRLLTLSAAWIITTRLAFAAIRRGLIDYHKESPVQRSA